MLTAPSPHVMQGVERKHEAMLQMYGEKAEEAEELKLDILDLKAMYRQQVRSSSLLLIYTTEPACLIRDLVWGLMKPHRCLYSLEGICTVWTRVSL